MAYALLGTPKPQFFDSSGSPLASGTLSVLEPADDTNKTYYPTADDADAGTNGASGDITLNSRGETPNGLYGAEGETYKLVLKDAVAATIWTQDDIRVPQREGDAGLSTQTLTDAGAVSLTDPVTHLVTTGAAAVTLADGSEGQRKTIVMKTDGGDATVTPSNFANGTNMVFSNAGETAFLLFTNASWHWMGGTVAITGATISYLQDVVDDTTPTLGGPLDGNDEVVSKVELKDISATKTGPTITAGAITFDLESGNVFEVVLTESITSITISNPPASGDYGYLAIRFKQDATGSWTVTGWPASVDWVNSNGAPTITTTATTGKDWIELRTFDGGTEWDGNYGQNYG